MGEDSQASDREIPFIVAKAGLDGYRGAMIRVLSEPGVAEAFTPGASTDEIVEFVRAAVDRRDT